MPADGTPCTPRASTDIEPDIEQDIERDIEPGPSQDTRAGIDVRPFAPGDTAAVRALVLAGLAEHWGTIDPTRNPDLDDLAAAHPGSSTLVAVDGGGTIVGTGTVVPRGGGDAEVIRMSVAAHRRGDGIGRRVLDALVDVARSWGVRRLVLETTATWAGTIAFYERCGFVVTHHAAGDVGTDTWFERRLDDRRGERDAGDHHGADD